MLEQRAALPNPRASSADRRKEFQLEQRVARPGRLLTLLILLGGVRTAYAECSVLVQGFVSFALLLCYLVYRAVVVL